MGRVSEGVCRGQRPLEGRAGPDSRLQPDEPLAPHKCKPVWATREQVSHQLGSAGSLSKNPHPGSGPHQVRDSLHWPRSPPPSAQDAHRTLGTGWTLSPFSPARKILSSRLQTVELAQIPHVTALSPECAITLLGPRASVRPPYLRTGAIPESHPDSPSPSQGPGHRHRGPVE